MSSRSFALLVLLAGMGCGSPPLPTIDDAGDDTLDAGDTRDAGDSDDAGPKEDAGEEVPDAGEPPDAGQPFDSGVPHDAGTPRDAGQAPLVLAVIGDYGVCGAVNTPYIVTCPQERAVAALVHRWNPDAILTTGDNSYGSGTAAQIPGDQAPYAADVTAGHFYPCMGNHDWGSGNIQPSLSYFHVAKPHYEHSFGSLLTAYVLDTNPGEPDGDTSTSTQATRFRQAVAASTSRWKLAFNHQAPHSSCGELSYDGSGGRPDYRWVAARGIDAVLSGHSHVYERLLAPNADSSAMVPFLVVGASGAPLQQRCSAVLPGQQRAVYGEFGALKVVVTDTKLTASFIVLDGGVRDSLVLTR